MKELPPVLFSKTIQQKTGCGNLYTTICSQKDRPVKLSATLGSTGTCFHAMNEALSEVISIALRSGAHEKNIIKALANINCDKPVGFGATRITSCADGISKSLQEACNVVETKKDGTNE